MKRISLTAFCLCVVTLAAHAQTADRGLFVEPKNEFYDTLLTGSKNFRRHAERPADRKFQLDFSRVTGPSSPTEFTTVWHTPPVSQGISGMCWSYSATSFFESEAKRLYGAELKLSELYTVYWEYVEKAREYVRTRGTSAFAQGSEGNAVPRIWKKYGVVPADAYTGLLPGQRFHDHDAMFEMMSAYLTSVKASNAWDEEAAVRVITSIMNGSIGQPPSRVTVGGTSMTPKEYLANVVKLNLDDYVEVMSLMQKPYNTLAELPVPDNWWHSTDYYNVTLPTFTAIVREAIRRGMSLAIGGDTSEPGYEGHAGLAVIPSFDIPAGAIDENARQFRFSNGTTGDDHGIHLVGYLERDGTDWYLIKDSGSGSRNNTHPGYYFYHSDYVKLKMLSYTVHRDAVKEVLPEFAK
jgi:bleomycin hydrolase